VPINIINILRRIKTYAFLGLSETATHAKEYVMDTLSGGKQGNWKFYIQMAFSFSCVLLAVVDTATSAKDTSVDAATGAKDYVKDTLTGAKDTTYDAAAKAREKLESARSKIAEKGHGTEASNPLIFNHPLTLFAFQTSKSTSKNLLKVLKIR
jgi:hypothetical protein